MELQAQPGTQAAQAAVTMTGNESFKGRNGGGDCGMLESGPSLEFLEMPLSLFDLPRYEIVPVGLNKTMNDPTQPSVASRGVREP